jgi:hypothetical protein
MSFQSNVIASGTASTGYAVPFSPSAMTATIVCRSGEFWVKSTSGTPTAPTTPVSTGLVAGWNRMLAGDRLQIGLDSSTVPAPAAASSLADPIGGLQVWCATGGDLNVIAH